jgi:hypothetical protein
MSIGDGAVKKGQLDSVVTRLPVEKWRSGHRPLRMADWLYGRMEAPQRTVAQWQRSESLPAMQCDYTSHGKVQGADMAVPGDGEISK